MLRKTARTVLGLLLKDYAYYTIFERTRQDAPPRVRAPADRAFVEVGAEDLARAADAGIRGTAGYCGPQCAVFACVDAGEIVGVCVYWWNPRYRERNFWPLADDDAKLVELLVVPSMRGRGIASTLIAQSAETMFARGFRRLYARVWHSHAASQRSFLAAGWRPICNVVDVLPRVTGRRWRFERRLAQRAV